MEKGVDKWKKGGDLLEDEAVEKWRRDLGSGILGLREGLGGLEMWIFGWNVRLEGTFGSAWAEETVDLGYGMGGLRAGFWEFMCGFGEIFSVVLALILQSVSK